MSEHKIPINEPTEEEQATIKALTFLSQTNTQNTPSLTVTTDRTLNMKMT